MTDADQPSVPTPPTPAPPVPVAAPPVAGGTPPGTPTQKPHGKALAILLGGGFLLAFGGCALFLGTLNVNSGNTSPIGLVGAIGFVVGLGMFAIGAILALVLVVVALFGPKRK